MVSCKKANRLMSEGLDRKLRLGERVALRLHLTLCNACSRVEKQFKLLRRASQLPEPIRQPHEPRR